MIKQFFVSGDCHGNPSGRVRAINWNYKPKNPEEIGVILLGDVGLNYWLNKRDKREKQETSKFGFHIFCVRGNHEERPENIFTMKIVYNEDVQGKVFQEEDFPLIHYFIDGETYNIQGLKTIVIGGGYSVDKYYRLEVGNNWFPMEQLSPEERERITESLRDGDYKLILAHTCPYSWRPTDLFLTCVNQSTVDSSMELWLEDIKDSFQDAFYLFGHYHADRLVRPKAEMYYHNVDSLDNIIKRWDKNREDSVEELMFSNKDPNYYWGR